ncbi:MAG: type II toxin-antitoxin system PemK/MazF family toxin [Cyanobacteria bacterium P01_G01_bin.19]
MSGLESFQPQRGAIADFNLNPVKGSETGKIRPFLVVTNNVYNSKLKVIQVVPITEWSEKKSRIITNVTLTKTGKNGLSKKSIADCLQTRPLDYTKRFIKYRGEVNSLIMQKIDRALAVVFGIN